MVTAAAAAAVVAAGVSFIVMMAAAAEIFPELQGVVEKGFGNFADIALSAAHHKDEGRFEGIDGAAADAAANENIHLLFSQQCSQCPVAGVPGRDDFFTGDLAVQCFKNGKSGGMSEVLKHLMIFTSHCNFHKTLILSDCGGFKFTSLFETTAIKTVMPII